jgi:hypothetical protein
MQFQIIKITVDDGTKCKPNSNDICINGFCHVTLTLRFYSNKDFIYIWFLTIETNDTFSRLKLNHSSNSKYDIPFIYGIIYENRDYILWI